MRVVVDLNRCQSYGQCVYAAGATFWFQGRESLEYDHCPDESQRAAVARAVIACPVAAITVGGAAGASGGRP